MVPLLSNSLHDFRLKISIFGQNGPENDFGPFWPDGVRAPKKKLEKIIFAIFSSFEKNIGFQTMLNFKCPGKAPCDLSRLRPKPTIWGSFMALKVILLLCIKPANEHFAKNSIIVWVLLT